jgi:hypothetical protein
MKKIILILVLIVIIAACRKPDAEPYGSFSFCFENPQPNNDSELDHFPNKFKGLYRNDDSTFIRIEEDRILKENFMIFKVHKLQMDSLKSGYDIVDGKLVTRNTRHTFDMKLKGDSIELSHKLIDTLFRFSYTQKAKRINGQLILSTKDSIFWNIQFLSIEKNILKFKNLYEKNDLIKLDSVTVIKSKMLDSVSYLIKPTRNEFKKILRTKNLGLDYEYKKIPK